MNTDERIDALQNAVGTLRTAIAEVHFTQHPRHWQAGESCMTCAQLETAKQQLQHAPHNGLPTFGQAVNEFKRQLLSFALAENEGVMKYAAAALGMKYTTFVEMAHRLEVVGNHRSGNGAGAASPHAGEGNGAASPHAAEGNGTLLALAAD
ncbi:MAG: hypothetical protein ACE5HV_02825 [Acidobacteriota bacterium]